MNKIILIGNLTRNPEQGITNSNIPYTRFTLAVNRTGTDSVDFINCIAWRKTAELVGKFCEKGKKVCVVGSLQINIFENSQGEKRTSADVVINDIEFLSSSKTSTQDESVTGLAKIDENELDEDLPF